MTMLSACAKWPGGGETIVEVLNDCVIWSCQIYW